MLVGVLLFKTDKYFTHLFHLPGTYIGTSSCMHVFWNLKSLNNGTLQFNRVHRCLLLSKNFPKCHTVALTVLLQSQRCDSDLSKVSTSFILSLRNIAFTLKVSMAVHYFHLCKSFRMANQNLFLPSCYSGSVFRLKKKKKKKKLSPIGTDFARRS